MAIDPRLSLGVQAPQIQSFLDPMLKVQDLRAGDERNMLLNRRLQQEDLAQQRQNKLSQIVAGAYQNNKLNPSLAAQKLAEAGMGNEALQMSDMEREQLKEQRLQQKDQLETLLKNLNASQKIVLGSSAETWETRDRPLLVQLAKQSNPDLEDLPEESLPHQWNPDLVSQALEKSKTVQQRLQEAHQQALLDAQMYNAEENRKVTMRGQDLRPKPLSSQEQSDIRIKEAEAKAKIASGKETIGRPLPASTIDKITKTQSGKEEALRLLNTFKPEYAGYTVTGGLSNIAGRVLGDESGQAQWWQDYQTRKNQVRNDLFGSALTPTEQAEWEKSDINPRMDSKEITKNLKRRKEIEDRGYQRQIENYAKGGYDVRGFQEQTPETPPPPGGTDWRNDPEYEQFLKEYNLGGQ